MGACHGSTTPIHTRSHAGVCKGGGRAGEKIPAQLIFVHFQDLPRRTPRGDLARAVRWGPRAEPAEGGQERLWTCPRTRLTLTPEFNAAPPKSRLLPNLSPLSTCS